MICWLISSVSSVSENNPGQKPSLCAKKADVVNLSLVCRKTYLGLLPIFEHQKLKYKYMNYTSEIKSDSYAGFKLVRIYQIVKTPILLGLLITPIRFGLELLEIPDKYIFLIGLLWFSLGLSIYWGIKHYRDQKPLLLIAYCLIILSLVTRIPVSLLWLLESKFQIGTHYGLFFESFPQALLNQVIYGSLIQLIPGIILSATTIAVIQKRKLKHSENE